MDVNNYYPVQTSPFTTLIKLKAKLWRIVNSSIFRYSPFFFRKYRIFLLNLFGAQIDWSCSINRKANIDYPWNLAMNSLSSLGENTWVYCLDTVKIGKNCCIGKDVYLLTGSHMVNDKNFKLITKPIIIEDGVWISTRANILPGIRICAFSVVGTNSVVTKNIEPYSIVGGNPAKFIKKRILNG